MVSSLRYGSGALVRGVRGEDLRGLPIFNTLKGAGSVAKMEERRGIAIGWRMALAHGVGLGDTLSLISPQGPETAFGTAPRVRAYPIVAIFNVGMSEYDTNVVYMSLSEAQDFFLVPSGVTAIDVRLKDPDDVDRVVAEVSPLLPGTRVLSWKQTNHTFFAALAVERNVMFLILTLITLVAALNMVSGLILLVKDKGHSIAILRTMGATRGAVLRIFFMTGALIGVLGTLVGVVLGVLVCAYIEEIRRFFAWVSGADIFSAEVYYLSTLPARMDVLETVLIVLMGLGLSFLATLYPAWRAARLEPAQALRYE